MKRIVILSVVALIAMSFVACNGDDVKKYKGTYKGTYTFKEDGKTKDGTVIVAVNPVKDNSILVFGVINLDNVSGGVYESTSEETALIANILQAIGVDLGTTTTDQIKKITVKCEFSGDRLNMTVSYGIEVLGIATLDVRVINFTGTKMSK